MAIETYKLSDGSTRYKAVAYLEGNQKTSKRGFKTKKRGKEVDCTATGIRQGKTKIPTHLWRSRGHVVRRQ